MSLFLSIGGKLLAMIGTFTAIIGNTWDSKKLGIRKLTTTGWIAGGVAFLGLSLSLYTSISDHNTRKSYENIALKDVKGGWRQMLVPWMLVRWEVTGDEGNLDLNTVQTLLDAKLQSKFDSVDFSEKTKITQYEDASLGFLMCKQTSTGMHIMEGTVKTYATMISPEVIATVKAIRQSPVFGELLAAGCGTATNQQPNFSLFSGMFSSDEVDDYLNALINLGTQLGDPGMKPKDVR
jgi:hypothetical protein